MTYVFIPCRHPEHPHSGRNTFHGPCQAKIDKEGTICGWEPPEEERQKLLRERKEHVVKVKGEPLKKVKETLGEPIVDEFMPREELAPPVGETATLEVNTASEVPGTVEEFEAGSDSVSSDQGEKPEPPTDSEDPTEEYETDQGYCAEHSKLVREFGPCLGAPEDPCLRTCHAWMPPRPEPVPTVGWCKQGGQVTMVDGLESFCGCSELDPPAMCVTGCPDWLDRPEDAPECWGLAETPKDALCQQDGEECDHGETCLQATLALLAETGPVDGWCSILESKVELGGPCDATEPEMTCLNNCEHFQPLPETGEEVSAPAEYPAIYTPVPRRRYAVIDADTGEALQLSLLGAQWEDYRVKSERWSLSGGDETSQSEFEDKIVYRGRELRPGSVVEVVCRGYVKERAPIFKKDIYEGKTVIVIESLVEIELLGYRGGPIEVALNVDGEPKVYDEPKEVEPTPELEVWDESDCTGYAEVEIVEDEEAEEVDPDFIDFGGGDGQ